MPAADDAWIWDLLQIAPRPAEASRLTVGRLERLLKRFRIRRVAWSRLLAFGEVSTALFQLCYFEVLMTR
jgi:hypothetical protein